MPVSFLLKQGFYQNLLPENGAKNDGNLLAQK